MLIIQALRHTIAARAGRDRRAAPLVLLAWPYLHRVAIRLEALIRRIQAGDAATSPARPRAAASHPRPRRLPRGFAWMIRLAPEAASLGGQLRTLLADPDYAALLADPRAGRILRPLCRMLGIDPDPDLPPTLLRSSAPCAPASPPPEARAPQSREPGPIPRNQGSPQLSVALA